MDAVLIKLLQKFRSQLAVEFYNDNVEITPELQVAADQALEHDPDGELGKLAAAINFSVMNPRLRHITLDEATRDWWSRNSELLTADRNCGDDQISFDAVVDTRLVLTGENEGPNWHWIVELFKGWAYVHGGCDYTGWN